MSSIFSDTNMIIGSTKGLFFFAKLFWFSCLDYLKSQNYVDHMAFGKFKFACLHGCKFRQPPKLYTRVATKHTEWNREPFWFLQSKKTELTVKNGFSSIWHVQRLLKSNGFKKPPAKCLKHLVFTLKVYISTQI